MLAYCLNNPVNYTDKNGKAADSFAGMGGEVLGEWLYEAFSGNTHPNKQTRELENRIAAEQHKIISNAGKTIWDAYMRGYNIQQASQIQETQMVLEGARKIYQYYNKHEELQQGVSGGKRIVAGALNIRDGLAAILVPVPTTSEDLIGVAKITGGIIKVCYGVAEVIGALMR